MNENVMFQKYATMDNQHQIQTGEKLHPCEICNEEFLNGDHLMNHLWTHTSENPQLCKICKKCNDG